MSGLHFRFEGSLAFPGCGHYLFVGSWSNVEEVGHSMVGLKEMHCKDMSLG